MGVFGLSSYCDSNLDECSSVVSLGAETVSALHKATLVVDGSGLIHFLQDEADDPHGLVAGGDYRIFDTAVAAWLQPFISAGWQLVVMFDPASSTAADADEALLKSEELRKRFEEKVKDVALILDQLDAGADIDGIAVPLPSLSKEQGIQCMRRTTSVQVMTCDREADPEMARFLRSTPGAYGIIAQDSDFFVMSGCRYLPLRCRLFSAIPCPFR
jgi:hypothetical protein